MTSETLKGLLDDAEVRSDELILNSRSDVAKRLQAVLDACRAIVKAGGTVSVSSVRGWLVTNRGISIAPSTLMNLRTDPKSGEKVHAPARRIIDMYVSAQRRLSTSAGQKGSPPYSSVFVTEAEISEIADHQTRYKVQLLTARVRNLETQLNHVRAIGRLPELSAGCVPQDDQGDPRSDEPKAIKGGSDNPNRPEEFELDALLDFLNASAMRRRKIGFNENGALIVTHPPGPATRTSNISKPFFETALQKIIQHLRERP